MWELWLRRAAWGSFLLMWVPFGQMILAGAGDEDRGHFIRPLLLFVLLCGLFIILFFLSFRVGRFEKDRLRRTGIPAKATVISIRKTGTSINDQPLMAIELEVHHPYGARFRATAEYFMPYPPPPEFSPGRMVQVFFLEDTREVAVDGL